MGAHHRGIRPALIALCALALVPPGASAASWSPPDTVTHVPFRVEAFSFGIDADGGALADWGLRRVQTASGTGARWRVGNGPPILAPRVLVDGSGRAVHFGFANGDAVPAVATGPLGRPGRVHRLDVNRPRRAFFALEAAGNRRGDAIVAWSAVRNFPDCERCEDVFVSVRRGGGAFGPRRRIAGDTSLDDLRVAMNEAGEAVVLWTRTFEYDGGEAYARVMGSDGDWSARERIPGDGYTVPSDGATDIALAMDSGGRALVAFASMTFGEGADPNDYPLPVEYSVRRPGRGFTGLRQLSRDSAIGGRQGFVQGRLGNLDAAYVGAGTALVAWTAFAEEDRHAHAGAALVRGVEVVRRQALSSGPLEAEIADVAAGPGGTGLVLLYTRGQYFHSWVPRELRSVLVRDGAFEPAQVVRRGGSEIDFASAGIDSRGRARAAWIERLRHGRTAVRTASLRTR